MNTGRPSWLVLVWLSAMSMVAASCAPAAPPVPAPQPTTASAPQPPPAAIPAAPAAPAPTARPAAVPPPTPRPAAPSPTPQAQIKRGGTMNIAYTAYPHHDPHQATWSMGWYDFAMEQPLRQSADTGEPIPWIVEKWDYPNGTTLMLHVRKGVHFHNLPPVNGREFNAQDLAFSLERLRTDKATFPRRGLFEGVKTIEATDASTVKITFAAPFAPFFNYLGSFYFRLTAPEIVKQYGDLKLAESNIGTGPFVRGTWRDNVGGKLSRNPDYWQQGRPYLDTVNVIIVPDKAAQIAAWRVGKLDVGPWIAGGFQLDEMEAIQRTTPAIQWQKSPFRWPNVILMNNAKPPFNDMRVRQAVSLAIDRQEMLDIDVGKNGGHISAPLSYDLFPGWTYPAEKLLAMPGYRQPKDQDITEAKRLLKEAGYEKGLTVEALTSETSGWINKTPVEVAKSQLQKVGVTLNLKLQDFNTYLKNEVDGNFQMVGRGHATENEPDDQLFTRYHSKGGRNTGNYRNAEVDRLIELQRGTLDLAKRRQMVLQIQDILMKEAPQVVLVTGYSFFPYQPYVKGLDRGNYDPWGDPSAIWLSK